MFSCVTYTFKNLFFMANMRHLTLDIIHFNYDTYNVALNKRESMLRLKKGKDRKKGDSDIP